MAESTVVKQREKHMKYRSKEIKEAEELWFTERKADYEPFFTPEFPENDKNAAIRLMMLLGLDPETEAEPICNIISQARNECGKDYVKEASKKLADHYKAFTDEYAVRNISYLFLDDYSKYVEAKSIADCVIILCQRKLNRKTECLDEAERAELEGKIQRIKAVRARLVNARKKSCVLHNKWCNEHYLRTRDIYFSKKIMSEMSSFHDLEDPTNDSRYGMCIGEKEYANGAKLKLTLSSKQEDGKEKPTIHVELTHKEESFKKDYEITDDILNKIFMHDHFEVGDYTYYMGISIYDECTREMAKKTLKKTKSLLSVEYPTNLTMKVYDIDSPEHVTKEMLETVENAFHSLPEKNQNAILLRLKEKKTYNDIGKAYGLPRTRAEQLYKKGLNLLDFSIRLNASKTQAENKRIVDCMSNDRLTNALARAGIQTIKDLKETTWERIAKARCIGKKSMKELHKFLDGEGITLKDERKYNEYVS